MRLRAVGVFIGWMLTLAVAVGAGWVAGNAATTPPAATRPVVLPVTVEVEEITIEVTEPYPVSAVWPLIPTTPNGMTGILTSVSDLPDGTSEGDVVYTVDLFPVVAAQGDIVSFRDLKQGDAGEDVLQLQEFLIRAGYFSGEADGKFTSATAKAVDTWGDSLGQDLKGTVAQGTLLFIPSLPARLVPDPEVRVGTAVALGVEVLRGSAAEPMFTANVMPEALDRFAPGQQVMLGASAHRAVVERVVDAPESGGMQAVLGPEPGEDSICGDGCMEMAKVGATTILTGNLVVVPATTGPGVPTTALWTDPMGSTCVEMADGSARRVDAKASSEGRTLVVGLSAGEAVNAAPSRDASC